MTIYKCTSCGTSGVKLWRLWNTFLDYQRLFCAGCATDAPVDDDGVIRELISQRRVPRTMNVVVRTEGDWRDRTDQITSAGHGVLVPAVPCPLPHRDGSLAADYTFWGYSAVPSAGVDWWRALPTYKEKSDDHR